MTAFKDDPAEWQRLDWSILQNGAISLYHSKEILAADAESLASDGYRIVRVDCTEWARSGTPHPSLARALAFPDYYGANLHALRDVLTDLEILDEGGLALVLERLDAYVSATDLGEAWEVLDVFEDASRHFLLTGRRLLVLAQSDDPHLHFESVGARPITWNRQEWLDGKRISPAT
jgi:RNAse (barnase) inhibitor barstar